MPDSLIAIVTAAPRITWRQAIRATWLSLVPKSKADVVFFSGAGYSTFKDEVIVDCDDSYRGLPEKVRAILRWARERDYQHIMKCDDDTVMRPDRLLASDYRCYDFVGNVNRYRNDYEYYIPCGPNYWLSAKAADIVAGTEILPNNNDDEGWISGILFKQNIKLHSDSRYRLRTHRQPRLGMPCETRDCPCTQVVMDGKLKDPFPHMSKAEAFSWSMYLDKKTSLGSSLDEFFNVFEYSRLLEQYERGDFDTMNLAYS